MRLWSGADVAQQGVRANGKAQTGAQPGSSFPTQGEGYPFQGLPLLEGRRASEAEMGRETGLTKREQQIARRKLLALGVIAMNKETEETTRENQTTWQKTLEKLRADLPPGEAETRLTGTTLLQVTDTAACISVPSTSVLVWLERRMYGQIFKAMKGVLGKDLDLQFVAAT